MNCSDKFSLTKEKLKSIYWIFRSTYTYEVNSKWHAKYRPFEVFIYRKILFTKTHDVSKGPYLPLLFHENTALELLHSIHINQYLVG